MTVMDRAVACGVQAAPAPSFRVVALVQQAVSGEVVQDSGMPVPLQVGMAGADRPALGVEPAVLERADADHRIEPLAHRIGR